MTKKTLTMQFRLHPLLRADDLAPVPGFLNQRTESRGAEQQTSLQATSLAILGMSLSHAPPETLQNPLWPITWRISPRLHLPRLTVARFPTNCHKKPGPSQESCPQPQEQTPMALTTRCSTHQQRRCPAALQFRRLRPQDQHDDSRLARIAISPAEGVPFPICGKRGHRDSQQMGHEIWGAHLHLQSASCLSLNPILGTSPTNDGDRTSPHCVQSFNRICRSHVPLCFSVYCFCKYFLVRLHFILFIVDLQNPCVLLFTSV